ncbi:MAG: sigma-70 family RNA polymerase sigma factor [Polyangiaceae bacterium]|nr:sigma-70 family RNA polymerase sigma factor [Polyangiaceae bacterium]
MQPFATIYTQYFDFVWASVRRLGVAPAAVDDVVQDVFIVIHSRIHTLEQPESLRSWIYGVVRRTVSDHRRSQRVRLASGHALASETDAPCAVTPLDVAAQNEKVKLLFSLLEELDVSKREIFMMVELDELTVPEVAEILQIPVNTAYSRLRAARQAFEQALARHAALHERRAGLCPV